MDRTATGDFHGSILIHPPVDLQLNPRQLGAFSVCSKSAGCLDAASDHPDAPKLFLSVLPNDLELLAWDMVWERLVAVTFEPASGRRDEVGENGTQLVSMYVHDTIDASSGNPKHGIQDSSGFGLLQTIRDRIISHHLGTSNDQRIRALMGNAALLLALEHLIRGVVHARYALAEFYSVVETVENQLGDRKALASTLSLTKADLDLITRFANEPQYDQRHAPEDASSVLPIPPDTLQSAAEIARTIVTRYAKTIA